MAGSNGNGHHKGLIEGQTIFVNGEDKGARRILPPPCANRLENGGWCVLLAGHTEACAGLAKAHGPDQSIWHRHRGQAVMCGKVVADPVVCTLNRGHGGKCR